MYFRSVGLFSLFVAGLSAQTYPFRAELRGGGDPNRGKCTIEVVVDGTVEIEIRGDSAVMRNLKGTPPQWRRFICGTPMPPNPNNFRFAGVDGRGRQTLLRPPVNGGPAVVQIDDPQNGSEGYTFDIFWEGSDRGPGPGYRPPPPPQFTTEDAIRTCQDNIRDQARARFRGVDINFRRVQLDDNPGRRDWIVGSFEVRRGGFERDRPPEVFRFSCSVDFQSGRIRSADIQDGDNGRGDGGRPGGGGPSSVAMATQNCQRSVEDRLGRDGFGRAEFLSINVDDQPGRRDWIVGNVRASSRDGGQSFRFSCSVNLDTGDVRSVDVRPR